MTRQVGERLGTLGPVVAGLGAMLGAGVFAGLAPAAGLAGQWILLAVVIAALAAFCSACSMADAAPRYPGPGGPYRCVRDLLGPWPARLSLGPQLLGRMAAAAAVADCFGAYLLPAHPALAAIALLVVVLLADTAGLRPSPVACRVLVFGVLAVLAVVVVVCFALPSPPPTGLPVPPGTPGTDDPAELLPAAGVLLFAYLGFERVTEPAAGRRARPVVVPVLLLVTLGTYLAVSAAVLHQLGATRLALSPAPLRDALAAAEGSALDPVLAVAVLVATAGALFAVLGGGRGLVTAMAEFGDLPGGLGTPRASALPVFLGGVAGVLLLSGTTALWLAATCLLTGLAFSNAAARLLPRVGRVFPRRTSCFGLGLCVLLTIAMPAPYLAAAVVSVGAGAGLAALVSLRRAPARR